MEDSQAGGGRHVRTEDLLAPPPVGRAIGLAGLAAVVGAVVWALLIIYAQREHGVIAWGIGGLIGFAIVKAGGYGQTLCIAGASLAVLSIAAGKQISYQVSVSQAIDESLERIGSQYDVTKVDARDWAALGDSPSDDAVEQFALDHDFDVDSAEEMRTEFGPDLVKFAKEQPTREQWIEQQREVVEEVFAEEYTFLDYLKEDFSPIDILFAVLGLATAYGMVHRRTIELQVEAREQIRAERAAEEAAQTQEDE